MVTAEQAVDALTLAAGDQMLAAERLHVTREQLAGIIASDPLAVKRLQDQLRVITLLDAQLTLDLAQAAMRSAIHTLDAKDLVTLVGRQSELIAKMTDDKTTVNHNVNTIEFLMRSLPPDVRETVTALLAPAMDAEFSEVPASNSVIDPSSPD